MSDRADCIEHHFVLWHVGREFHKLWRRCASVLAGTLGGGNMDHHRRGTVANQPDLTYILEAQNCASLS
jgi:hypothetical protein